jgi:hypothetical protein
MLARDLSLGPRGDGTGDCRCCCTFPLNDGDMFGTATLCGLEVGLRAVGLDALPECCVGGGTNSGEEGSDPLRAGNPAPPDEPISMEPAPYAVVPSFCFLLPNVLSRPPVNALTLPLLVELFIADDGASCRSTSCGYGRPSGAREMGWESTARSVISVAEVLSMRMGNWEAPETLREAGIVGREDWYCSGVE